MKELIKGLISGPIYVGKIALKCIKYLGIGVWTLLVNKVTLFVLIVCLFMGLLEVSSGFREEIISKEKEMFYIDESSLEYYYDSDIVYTNYKDNMAITDMIKCYQSNIDLNNVPENILDNINKLNSLYASNNKYFSFVYQDLFSGFTVSYNMDGAIFTASTIKAPAIIYIYEMASKGNIDLSERLTYTREFYHGGTGVIQNKEFNTTYSIEELVQYTIYDSDNIAYKMLMNRFGQDNIYAFWKEKGTKNIFDLNTIWGYMSARDALTYMKELYKFSLEDEQYGSKLLEHFKKAKFKLVGNRNLEYNTANKSGWSGSVIHDVAIVFDENPYILAVFSNLGESSYNYLFSESSKLIGNLHHDYWKYKEELCSNIKLY